MWMAVTECTDTVDERDQTGDGNRELGLAAWRFLLKWWGKHLPLMGMEGRWRTETAAGRDSHLKTVKRSRVLG